MKKIGIGGPVDTKGKVVRVIGGMKKMRVEVVEIQVLTPFHPNHLRRAKIVSNTITMRKRGKTISVLNLKIETAWGIYQGLDKFFDRYFAEKERLAHENEEA